MAAYGDGRNARLKKHNKLIEWAAKREQTPYRHGGTLLTPVSGRLEEEKRGG